MASACVNNVGVSSKKFLDCAAVKCPSYGWMSPRISFSCEFPDEEAPIKPSVNIAADSSTPDEEKQEDSDPEISCKDFIDFEFRLDDPVKMLPADELFSDGKLVPLQLSTIRRKSVTSAQDLSVLKSEEAPKSRRRNEISSTDPYLFSPKAPSCSSIHWKELLGFKKLYQNSHEKQEIHETASSTSLSFHNQSRTSARSSSVKQFLLRGASKSGLNLSIDSSSSTLPLLKESNNESPSISSRLSLSSSSPGHHEYGDLPRHSLDSDKPSAMKRLPRVRAVKKKAEASTSSARVARSPVRRKTPESTAAPPVRDVSADSPRMISSGKILFHSLERSSSSPSTLNGGPRYKHRGMERSNSAHVVRVTPVLNVPVCTIRGLFSSPQKVKDGANANKTQQHRTKNRTDRT